MEQEDTAISKMQIGLGAELWATVHIFRNSKDPEFDPNHPPKLSKKDVEELLGLDADAQGKIARRVGKRLTANVIR